MSGVTSEGGALAPAIGRVVASGEPHPWRAPGLLIPLVFVLVLVTAMAAPEWFTARQPDAVDVDAILLLPSRQHWFGTDDLGRDLFCRMIYGTSQSLAIGVGATALGCLGGIALGTAAALAPSLVRQFLVRLIDILLAFPDLLLALLVIAVLGRGPVNTLLAVGLAHMAGYARVVARRCSR